MCMEVIGDSNYDVDIWISILNIIYDIRIRIKYGIEQIIVINIIIYAKVKWKRAFCFRQNRKGYRQAITFPKTNHILANYTR